jgi:hypothetical protein
MLVVDRVLSFNYPRREVGVAGWCCLDTFTPAEELWAELDGMRVPCLTGIPRPDVARYHHAPALAGSGFLGRFPVPRAMPVRLIARHDGLEHSLAEFPAGWPGPHSDHPESGQGEYTTWLRTHESELHWPPSEIERRLHTLSCTPVISVILPTYNTHLYHLHRCIESVTAQLYPYWELCITDDASPDPRVRHYLLERASNETRIRLSFSDHRGGISAASNQSIASCTGDFIVLLDHDDELHPSAMLELARCLSAHGDADVIYSDEDKIDQVGVRSYPSFKPEFDEDLLCGFNYLGHLVSMRTSLVRQVGGFRSDSDGAQDWDLLLRVTSATRRDRIRHIPKPLYHWRMHEDSTAFSLDAKPYAIRAWNAVLERRLESAETCTVRDGLFLGSMRIVRRLPEDTRISILNRACDGSHQRRALNRSRVPRRASFFEVILSAVHPAELSDTGALMTVEDLQSDVTIVVACGIDSVNHQFLEELAAQALREDCGIVGGTVLSADRTVLTAGLASLSDGTLVNPFEGMVLDAPGYMGQARVLRRVSSISPHVFAFRTSRLLDVNGLASISEDRLSDLCGALVRSAHATGLKVLHTPYAVATLRSRVTTFHPQQREPGPPDLTINRNLESFSNMTALLKAGIP